MNRKTKPKPPEYIHVCAKCGRHGTVSHEMAFDIDGLPTDYIPSEWTRVVYTDTRLSLIRRELCPECNDLLGAWLGQTIVVKNEPHI